MPRRRAWTIIWRNRSASEDMRRGASSAGATKAVGPAPSQRQWLDQCRHSRAIQRRQHRRGRARLRLRATNRLSIWNDCSISRTAIRTVCANWSRLYLDQTDRSNRATRSAPSKLAGAGSPAPGAQLRRRQRHLRHAPHGAPAAAIWNSKGFEGKLAGTRRTLRTRSPRISARSQLSWNPIWPVTPNIASKT